MSSSVATAVGSATGAAFDELTVTRKLEDVVSMIPVDPPSSDATTVIVTEPVMPRVTS